MMKWILALLLFEPHVNQSDNLGHNHAEPLHRTEDQLSNGGGGGSRTRVRWHSAVGSTCLASSINLARERPDDQGVLGDPDCF